MHIVERWKDEARIEKVWGTSSERTGLGESSAEELISKGAKKIEESWRSVYYRG